VRPVTNPGPATRAEDGSTPGAARWPQVEDPADVEVPERARRHFHAGFSAIREAFRRTDADPARARRLWQESEPYRERSAALLGVSSPQALAGCETCAGEGVAASGRPCPGGEGTGVRVSEGE
jgi:hypothetical protein